VKIADGEARVAHGFHDFGGGLVTRLLVEADVDAGFEVGYCARIVAATPLHSIDLVSSEELGNAGGRSTLAVELMGACSRVTSMRAMHAMRWEYRPGSTFFLVWTQERTDQEGINDFDVGPNFRQLVRADADNIFLAKVTYYLNL